jgi:hypothetical protein
MLIFHAPSKHKSPTPGLIPSTEGGLKDFHRRPIGIIDKNLGRGGRLIAAIGHGQIYHNSGDAILN